MRFVLPLPPNIANARWHWAQRNRHRTSYLTLCTVADHRRPPEPIAPAVVTATLYVHNMMDDDNAVARLKWAIDWLKVREIIEDDHPACMTLAEVRQVVDRKRPRVEIRVEAMDA